ncbi:MAG: ketopantoate reductase family protein [Deltaproteobacteria bacterium]|nr:ketopantoate reductase family protein [Deltaproteobacteria bacterium]MBW2395732.1 ketopantoate reductase family protein [Deltaproteobacteria bacterium]
MSLTILGAGSVGLTLAARLARGGVRVLVLTRREAAAHALSAGLVAEHPADGTCFEVELDARCADHPETWPDQPVLLCTRGDGVEAAAKLVARRAPQAPLVTFQNDVVHEATAARYHSTVLGGVWRETCTRTGDARVRFLHDRPSRAIVGLHPSGHSQDAHAIAALLERGDIRSGVSECVTLDKWLKLCVNLMSTPNALIRREDHAGRDFVEIKVSLLEEARAVLAAAAIETGSCDGLDRSLDEEIAFQRASLERGTSARPIPLYNQVWSALTRRLPTEADAYHRRICDLGERHDVTTPLNRRVLEALLHAARTHTGPESLAASNLRA